MPKWTKEEVADLKKMWGKATRADLAEMFPGRTFDSIRYKAKTLELERRKTRNSNSVDWMADALERAAEGKTLTKKQTDALAKMLETNGVEIVRNDRRKKEPESKEVKIKTKGGEVVFGLLSCPHQGSKWEQNTALNRFYDDVIERGGSIFFNAGDLTDGAVSMHKGFEYGLHCHGADEQRDYAIEAYPRRDGCHTYVISGNHDLSFKKESGFNIVRAVCSQRDDMSYSGDWVADFTLPGGFRLRIRHGQGGASYARSYKLQKVMGSLDLRDDPPDLYAIGHWHYPCWLPVEQGVSAFMLSAFQGLTGYAKSLPTVSKSHVGGFVVTYQLDDEGKYLPGSIKTEFLEYPELDRDWDKEASELAAEKNRARVLATGNLTA